MTETNKTLPLIRAPLDVQYDPDTRVLTVAFGPGVARGSARRMPLYFDFPATQELLAALRKIEKEHGFPIE